MIDIHEALYTTRAMRRLRPDPIPLEVQARILDAAIHAPHIAEQWRFILVDDPLLKARLADLYRQAAARLFESHGVNLQELLISDSSMGRAARSGDYLARHFQDVPLILFGFGRTTEGSGVYPALWSAMLAARAEGIGSTLTTILQTWFADDVCDLLGVPADLGWRLHGTVPMGYPLGRWGVGARQPLHDVVGRNAWDGDTGFPDTIPTWMPPGNS